MSERTKTQAYYDEQLAEICDRCGKPFEDHTTTRCEPDRKWGVWCEVWGGVTGTRVGWLQQQGLEFETTRREEAERAARDCMVRARVATTACFNYVVRER